MVSLTIYDGAWTIGGNKLYLEENGRGILLDFGMNFATYGEFYQEFLTERSNRGIHDLVKLGLIPEINIYRPDLITADIDPSQWPKPNVEAILLSHAHLDHCGNIGLLKCEIPLITSSTSAAILKAMRDSSPSSLGSEISYYSPKVPIQGCDGLVLESDRKQSYIGRDIFTTENPNNLLLEFLKNRPTSGSSRSKVVEAGAVKPLSFVNLPFEVEAYPVDHSIPGAVSYILKGDTIIAYTGDYRIHGVNASKTHDFIEAARDASVLITEGTRVGRESDEQVTEEKVYQKCLSTTAESKGFVVADFSARNIERLQSFQRIVSQTNRTLVVTAKDAYILHALGCVDGRCIMDDDDMGIYSELKNRDRIIWESEIVAKKWDKKYVKPETIRKNPEQYIICFSFFDLKHLLDIKPEGGTYIYSSSEAYSEEDTFDFQRLAQWLKFFNLKTVGFKMVGDPPKPEFEKGYHASGHLSQNDLREVIDTIDPDVIIPIHSNHIEWFNNFPQTTNIPPNGKINL